MQYIRHVLVGLSSLGILITVFILATAGNMSQLAAFLIVSAFALNIFYVVFNDELSRPSRLINVFAGYFALAAVELKHRAETARLDEERADVNVPEAMKLRNARLEAAEEFLKFVANHGLQPSLQARSPEARQAKLVQARSPISVEGPSPAPARPVSVLLTSRQGQQTQQLQ